MNRILSFLTLTALIWACAAPEKPSVSIVISDKGSETELLAAKEIRKYIYCRTNELLPLVTVSDTSRISGDAIIVGASGTH